MSKQLLNFEEFSSQNKVGTVMKKVEKDLGSSNEEEFIEQPSALPSLFLDGTQAQVRRLGRKNVTYTISTQQVFSGLSLVTIVQSTKGFALCPALQPAQRPLLAPPT